MNIPIENQQDALPIIYNGLVEVDIVHGSVYMSYTDLVMMIRVGTGVDLDDMQERLDPEFVKLSSFHQVNTESGMEFPITIDLDQLYIGFLGIEYLKINVPQLENALTDIQTAFGIKNNGLKSSITDTDQSRFYGELKRFFNERGDIAHSTSFTVQEVFRMAVVMTRSAQKVGWLNSMVDDMATVKDYELYKIFEKNTHAMPDAGQIQYLLFFMTFLFGTYKLNKDEIEDRVRRRSLLIPTKYTHVQTVPFQALLKKQFHRSSASNGRPPSNPRAAAEQRENHLVMRRSVNIVPPNNARSWKSFTVLGHPSTLIRGETIDQYRLNSKRYRILSQLYLETANLNIFANRDEYARVVISDS